MTTRKTLDATTKHDNRGFHLVVQADGDAFGVTLFEVNGKRTLVARTSPSRTRDVSAAVQQAVKASGHQRTTLSARRKTPITLREDTGVRLALVLLATDGIRKGRRKSSMINAVDHMATEEAYYWYAKCVGADGARVKRALRIFLAEE